MGPALLPTPLSPTRGRPLPVLLTASRSLSPFAGHAWRPMSSPGARCLAAGALSGFRHRRSHRHPAFARASQRMVRAEARFHRYQSLRLAETACPSRLGYSATFRPEPLLASCSNQACSLSDNTASRPSQGLSTCIRPRPHACRLLKRAGTGVTAIFRT
jgi:hypothetical protein